MKKHNKQHDARAASFVRIGKAIRKLSPDPDLLIGIKALAKVFSDEAKLLRSMR